MTPIQYINACKVFNEIITEYCELHSVSMREFARTIREDVADISRWKAGRKQLTTRAIVAVCRLFPRVKPHDLNPDHFPDDLRFVFKNKEK